ncbi:YLX3-like protein [Mya arenaria]|uniref:YLX3-like protein n=1 Tax=Mya arenaria TaxID=6604 RepID=A0ABY7DIY8_MYAAR|nr:YLX3-like protein [Mya arenaria]
MDTQDDRRLANMGTQDDRRLANMSTQDDRRLANMSTQDDRRLANMDTQDDRRLANMSTQGDRRLANMGTQGDRRLANMGTQDDRRLANMSTQDDRRLANLSTRVSEIGKEYRFIIAHAQHNTECFHPGPRQWPTMSYSTHLEDMVGEMGGCGRFQWVTAIVVQASKTLAAWSMLHMTFNGQAPNFRCSPDPSNFSSNGSDRVFDNWDLNCDSAWIVAMITTIQMSGVLVGSFISGHLGDMIGRKPTFFLSLLLLVVVNVVAYFSVNWQMYAAVRFALGLGMGFYLTLQVNVMTEMVPIVWRARAVAFPAWAFEASIFALVAWLFKDWKNIHLATAVIGAPFLLTYLMTISYSYYGLTFGVSSLSGDLYVNMFLMNIIETPASFSLMYIVNRYGRKPVVILMFACTAACGFVVGIIQYVDTPHRGVITNVFALACKMGIAVGWGGLMVYTTELYPTVVR